MKEYKKYEIEAEYNESGTETFTVEAQSRAHAKEKAKIYMENMHRARCVNIKAKRKFS